MGSSNLAVAAGSWEKILESLQELVQYIINLTKVKWC